MSAADIGSDSTPLSANAVSPLEQRLQATNARIAHLLDQMSWKEEGALAPEHTSEEPTPNAAQPTTPKRDDGPAATAADAHATDLLTTCRPFDRAAFLSFVSTYSPLVWSHKDSAAVSPLVCARFGWSCSPSLSARDTLCCGLCHATLHVYFAPEIQAHPTAVAALAARYADMLATGHEPDCPWKDNPYDDNFTHILHTEPMERDTAVWIALNQLRARMATLAQHPAMRSLSLHDDFVQHYRQLLLKEAGPSTAELSLPAVLAICGWEARSPQAAAASTSLQCWFGCREVCIGQHCDATLTMSSDSKEEEVAAVAAEAVYDEEQEEEGERSIFQSPLKRRRLLPSDSSKPPMRAFPLDAVATPLIIRLSSTGFHPVRAHRPFCPFVQPLHTAPPNATDEKLRLTAVNTSPSIALETESESTEPLLGWEELFGWYVQRHHLHTPVAASSVAVALASSPALAVDGNANTTAAVSSLPHKEQQFKSVVATVRSLLSNAFHSDRPSEHKTSRKQ